VHKSTDLRPVAGEPVQPFLTKEASLFDRYILQGKLVDALEVTQYHKHLVGKVFNCHKRFRKKRCDQNHDWAVADWKANACSLRICPHCAHRRAKILASRTQEQLLGKTGLRYCVLAERNSENLQDGVRSLWKAWSSLRRSVRWKRKVKGCIVALEVTYNPEKKSWHPHLNMLMEGEYFPFRELNQAWIKATKGNGRTSHIRAADDKTVFELLKYALKVAERDQETREFYLIFDEPAAIDEFLSAVYGSRLVRSYGSLRGLKVDDEEKPEQEEERCPDCKSTNVIDLGPVSHSQLSFDFGAKVFRVVRPPSEADRAMHLLRRKGPRSLSTNPESIAIAVEARRCARQYERGVALRFAA
jgi:Zn finger protein HypA/HybF involved in hydrogenase expression